MPESFPLEGHDEVETIRDIGIAMGLLV